MSTFAGVDACPQCGAGLLPDSKCESCGYDPRPPRECVNCGWVENSRCKNCGATLSDNHIVRKQMPDNWLWLTCAYCGWPVVAYIDRSLELEPYLEPPQDDDESWGPSAGVGSLFGMVIAAIIGIFVIAVLATPIANLTTGNATGFNSNGNATLTAPAFGAIIKLFPLVFVFLGAIIVIKVFKD